MKSIPLVVGNAPSLWRFDSVQAALSHNTDQIAQLILVGARVQQNVPPASLPPTSGTDLQLG